MSTSSSPNSVGLTDVQTALALFAEAVAGRPVSFEVADRAAECWPLAASTPDFEGVRLPAAMPSRRAYRASVLQQVLVQPTASRPRDLSRANYDDVYRVVEDHRVDHLTRRSFPGAVRALHAAHALARAALVAEETGASPFDALVQDLRAQSLGGQSANPPAVVVASELLHQVAHVEATAQTSCAVAEAIARLFEGTVTGRSLAELLADVEPDEEDPALPSEGPTSVSLDGGTPTEFVETDGLGGGNLLGDGDELVPTAAAEDPDAEPAQLGLQLPTGSPATQSDAELRTFVYDEWDYHKQQHRTAWCRVIEEPLVGDDHGFIVDVRVRHQALRSRIRRSLMKLRTQEFVRVYRSDDGDELDLDAVIEAIADRRSGAPADERLHIRRDRAARDVATAFLVDLSASTSSAAVPPEPEPIPETDPMDDPMSYGPIWDSPPKSEPVRRVIDVAKDAVALMGEALHELGDRHAIYGFSGTGRDGVEFKIGKDFGDRVTPASWAAVAAMKPLRYTRMGPAVRHAAAKLDAESAKTKLLIIVSDGYPQDTDYGRDRHDRDYGIHDTARALADANQLGIETFCVTIDPAGHDYLRTMCPDHRYLVIDDVESLPEELAKLYVGRFHTARRVDTPLHT